MADTSQSSETIFGPTPSRIGALVDILIYVAVAFALWEFEELLREVGKFPYPGVFDGVFSLIGSFLVVVALVKWRGQSWGDLGLKKPARWWSIPLWGLAVLFVSVVAQLTVVPLLVNLLHAPTPDLSRYDVIRGNLSLFLISSAGTMITGGFMEEVIYRGLMIDRLGRLLGGGRRGLVFGALFCGVPFGLIHFQWGVGGMLMTAVMGAVLGLMYLVTKRNLWPLIFAHAALDFILMLQVYLGSLTA